MILDCVDASGLLRRLHKLFVFHKTFNNKRVPWFELTANIYPCRFTNIVPSWWFQAMIDRLNLFHMRGFKFWAGRWVVSVCGKSEEGARWTPKITEKWTCNCLITLHMHVANVLMGGRLIRRGGEVRGRWGEGRGFSPSKYLFSQILNSQFSSLSLGGDSNNCPKFMFSQIEFRYGFHCPISLFISAVYPVALELESDTPPMCISLDNHRGDGRRGGGERGRGGRGERGRGVEGRGGREGEGYTMAVYQNIYSYHFSDPSVGESTFINKIACMVNILSSPIRP